MTDLTAASTDLFLSLWNDAPNWSGMPLLDISAAEKGNLSDLKKKGLLTTEVDFERADLTWVSFTDAGKALGLELTGRDEYGQEVTTVPVPAQADEQPVTPPAPIEPAPVMKPLTDNMTTALNTVAAWILLERPKHACMNAVDGNAWSALYRRELFKTDENGAVLDGDFLTDAAKDLIDAGIVMENVQREQRRLTSKQAQLQQQLSDVTDALIQTHEVTTDTGMYVIEVRVTLARDGVPEQRDMKVEVILAEGALVSEAEARAAKRALALKWDTDRWTVHASQAVDSRVFGTRTV